MNTLPCPFCGDTCCPDPREQGGLLHWCAMPQQHEAARRARLHGAGMSAPRVPVGSVWRLSFDRSGRYDRMVCGVELEHGLVIVQTALGDVRYATLPGLTANCERIA